MAEANISDSTKKTILVVEDEPDAAELVEYNLKAAGFKVVLANDGPEALRKARSAKPDLVILDLMLPEIDGIQVCKLLRRDPATKHIAILMLTAKAAEVHLARCIALEGAPLGIRVNVVNPDAVLRGSKIWQGEWRQQRAQSNKVSEDELEEFYRKRSLLQRSVYPEDIAEATYFFASDLSAKSTGNFLNVDAGNAVSFTR